MTRFSARARKYLFALGGVGVLIIMQRFEIAIPGMDEMVSQVIAGLLIAEGVYRAPNKDA
jgi:hypothetical protein